MLLALQDIGTQSFIDVGAEMDVLGGWMICFFTLCVFSFLYKDNPFYKIAEHVFVGAGTAFFTLQYFEEGILDPIWAHGKRAFESAANGEAVELGAFQAQPVWALVFRGMAVLLGLMLLVRMFKPDSWMPRWPLAVMVGVYSALKLTGETQSKLVLQVKGLFKPFVDPLADPATSGFGDALAHVALTSVLVLGTLCALCHFIFTYRRTKVLAGVSRVGIVVLMITFGSMFGFTVLGRIALLIERVDWLARFNEPGYALFGIGTNLGQAVLLSPPMVITAIIVAVLGLGAMQSGSSKTA